MRALAGCLALTLAGCGSDGGEKPKEPTQACTFQQAEHPGYTTIARDVALCGGEYVPGNMASACATGWHVCRRTEWLSRYPVTRPYKTAPADPDLIGPTLGPLTSWGAPQSARCAGGVWEAERPANADTWGGSVCHVPDDTPTNNLGADYLPYNDGKFLFGDDGATVLQGYNAAGEADCCSWDVTFGEPVSLVSFAVYCCAD